MIIEFQCNEFCPNNCPYCKISALELFYDGKRTTERQCIYAPQCRYIVEQYEKYKESKD